jgi:hypothetical protein
MTELRKLVEFASEQAAAAFHRSGQVLPMWHAIKRSGDHIVFAPPPGADKATSVGMARAAFELFDVVRYVFMDEAWILNAIGREIGAAEMERINREGLSQHPDRVEVIMFSAEDEAEGMLTAHRLILRPERGKPKLKPLEIFDLTGVTSEGRMVGLLPRSKGNH